MPALVLQSLRVFAEIRHFPSKVQTKVQSKQRSIRQSSEFHRKSLTTPVPVSEKTKKSQTLDFIRGQAVSQKAYGCYLILPRHSPRNPDLAFKARPVYHWADRVQSVAAVYSLITTHVTPLKTQKNAEPWFCQAADGFYRAGAVVTYFLPFFEWMWQFPCGCWHYRRNQAKTKHIPSVAGANNLKLIFEAFKTHAISHFVA